MMQISLVLYAILATASLASIVAVRTLDGRRPISRALVPCMISAFQAIILLGRHRRAMGAAAGVSFFGLSVSGWGANVGRAASCACSQTGAQDRAGAVEVARSSWRHCTSGKTLAMREAPDAGKRYHGPGPPIRPLLPPQSSDPAPVD